MTTITKVGPLSAQAEAAVWAAIDAVKAKAQEHHDEAAACALLGRYREAYEEEIRSQTCESIARAVRRALGVSGKKGSRA